MRENEGMIERERKKEKEPERERARERARERKRKSERESEREINNCKTIKCVISLRGGERVNE
jgi:hypothetical protein